MIKIFLILTLFNYATSQTVYINIVAENNITGNGPDLMGIGMGHSSVNGNWAKFLERLGVNAVRLFVAPVSNLRTFISTNWGKDLNGTLVTDFSSFSTAVSFLRTSQGRDLTYPWTNPVKWKQIFDNIKAVTRVIYGSDENSIDVVNSLKIKPLVVENIDCDTLMFNQMDPKNSEYWSERWELYKHSYALAVWARNKQVETIEFYNEPDFDLGGCLNASTFNEYYLVRSLSIQNAYEDLNKVSASPVQIKIAASAFARKTFSGDLTSYLGEFVVGNKNLIFGSFQNDTNWNNMHWYTYHSYDKTGRDLYDDLLYLQNATKVAGSSFPIVLTEHNAHTSSNWDTIATTPDTALEASRLSAQIASVIKANCPAHYVFKFSITPSFSATRDVAKNGLHWGEITTDPFELSDSTLGAESFRLMTLAKQSQIFSITTADTSRYRAYIGVRTGLDNHILMVNDKNDSVNLTINFAQFGVNNKSKILVESVNEQSFGEVTIYPVGNNGILNLLIPMYSTNKLSIKNNLIDFSPLDCQLSCTAFAGTNSDIGTCGDSFNLIGTSNTIQHETTSVAMLKFQASNVNRNNSFLLKLNIEESTSDNRLVVLGLKNPLSYNETNFSWKYLKENGVLRQLSSGALIDAISKNFVGWNSSSDLTIVGHVAAIKNQVKPTMIDVTDYVRAVIDSGKTELNFLLYRPFRNPLYKTSAGPINADDLSNGTKVKISSAKSLNKPQIFIIGNSEMKVQTTVPVSSVSSSSTRLTTTSVNIEQATSASGVPSSSTRLSTTAVNIEQATSVSGVPSSSTRLTTTAVNSVQSTSASGVPSSSTRLSTTAVNIEQATSVSNPSSSTRLTATSIRNEQSVSVSGESSIGSTTTGKNNQPNNELSVTVSRVSSNSIKIESASLEIMIGLFFIIFKIFI